MTLDELIALARDDHGIDIPALQEKASKADSAVALSNKIQESLGASGLISLSNGQEASVDDLVGAVAEAGDRIVSLSARVDSLVQEGIEKAAETRVAALVKTGHILPKKKDAMKALLLSNPDQFEAILPESPIVRLSNTDDEEVGTETPEGDADKATVQSEIARLTSTDAAKAYIRS